MQASMDTLNALLRHCRDDADDLQAIARAMESFESYHQAIYRAELTRRLYACGALAPDAYREEYPARDRARTLCHNGLLAQVKLLNALAAEVGLPPFYDGEVSEEPPYRRQVADAVLALVRRIIEERT